MLSFSLLLQNKPMKSSREINYERKNEESSIDPAGNRCLPDHHGTGG